MKELYTVINKKTYYISIAVIISLMVSGLLVANSRVLGFGTGAIIHTILVGVLSICLLVYPKYETRFFRAIVIIVSTFYFYMLFFLYPETWSTFILICLIPALSIFFFDAKMFYFSLILNGVLLVATLGYIVIIDQGYLFPYIWQDLVGNGINFVASQVILFLIFYLTYHRVEKMKLYYEKIQQTDRLKTSGQLAAAVAHEIRNPLTVVKGFLEFYKNDPSIKKDMEKHFSLMINELNSAEYVISQFLEVAKPNTDSNTEFVDVKDTLVSVTDLLKSYGLVHNNDIHLHVSEGCFIKVNRIEFKQLMVNLIKNAIEASKNSSPISVLAEKNGDLVELRVIDFGCGMSEEEVKSLGTPFYSLKSKGTGLGMMICFNIVGKNKGTVSFESVKGEGTTVIVRFPYERP